MLVEQNKSLKAYNTFGLECHAASFVEFRSISELQQVLPQARAQKHLILGGGSNVLLTQNFEGLVLKNGIQGIEAISETAEEVLVKVGAGVVWHDFVLYALDQNWGGIENLSLIPGTVGAAPMQNIGAYGVEIKDTFDSLEAVKIESGNVQTFDVKACEFGYRESVFKKGLKGKFIIVSVTFRLTKKDHAINTSYGAISDTLNQQGVQNPTIQDVSQAVITIRQSKLPDPKKIGNSGSFFKNPTIDKLDYEALKLEYAEMPGYQVGTDEIKVPAGWLIEHAGWKGHIRGNVGVHKNQALVLVNYGGGNGSEIFQLAKDIQQSVVEKFGIELVPEVNVI